MSFRYILRFDSEEQAKAVLEPFGFVDTHIIYGRNLKLLSDGFFVCSRLFKGEGFWLNIIWVKVLNPELESAIAPYLQSKTEE